MTCTRCHRPHKGRYMRCYPCRQYEKLSAKTRAKKEFWRDCCQIAGEIVSRHINNTGERA